MKKHLTIEYLGILAALAVVIVPASASAATLYVQSSRSTMSVGDTVVVTVKIDADADVLNTIEGDIMLSSPSTSAIVQQFSLAGSAFGLWPRTPSLSTDGTDISFIGGVPGGFSIEGATVFKIVLQAKDPGTITISPKNISVLANDGKGTKMPVTLNNLAITVVPQKKGAQAVDDWAGVISADTTPPEPFIIVLGQDPSVFSGKKFAFFSAVDNQSGVAYYDVSENGAPPVRSGSMYVLQNQNGNVTLAVTAYDKAGNKRIALYPSSTIRASVNWPPVIITVIILVIVYMIFKRIWPRLRNDQRDATENI